MVSGPHITGCFLAADHLERIVFTDALIAGWRPAAGGFVTAEMTFAEHPEETLDSARTTGTPECRRGQAASPSATRKTSSPTRPSCCPR